MAMMQKILLTLALGFGGLITYVDSRPGWDDTGITAAAVFLTCGVLGFVEPKRPWLWVLAVGLWIPLRGIFWTHNYGSLLALLIALAGASAGVAIRNAVAPARA